MMTAGNSDRQLRPATMKVAIQGELGSFSHEAVLKFLSRGRALPCATSSDVFDALGSTAAAAALIPIENSLAGPVAIHLDLLLAREVWIAREFRLRIRHNLIALPGVQFAQLRRVLSHPVALEQCRDFLRAHPQLRAEPFYDTAGSVKHLAESGLRDTAAIASREAASHFAARVLRAGIEDDAQNYTRFFLIHPTQAAPARARPQRRQAGIAHPRPLPGSNKTSIVFSVKNQPGALFKALAVFALRDITLSKIESRPLRGRPFEYVFFADFQRGDDEAARHALAHLREISEFVKVLGIYPDA